MFQFVLIRIEEKLKNKDGTFSQSKLKFDKESRFLLLSNKMTDLNLLHTSLKKKKKDHYLLEYYAIQFINARWILRSEDLKDKQDSE